MITLAQTSQSNLRLASPNRDGQIAQTTGASPKGKGKWHKAKWLLTRSAVTL